MKTTAIFATLALTAALLSATTGDRVSYSASAYSLEGERPLYVERHVETWNDGRLEQRRVRYEDPAGGLIAEKLVRYGDTPQAPSFEMTDYRVGVIEGAEVDVRSVTLFSGPADRDNRRRSVRRPEMAVVDAGFDAFMRENFDAVAAGRKVDFDFAVPALRRFFRFQLVPEGEIVYRDQPAYRIKMRPASTFLRLLVDPIQLVYSRDGRLLEFQGLANVLDEGGDRYKARIVFDYPESDPASFPVGVAP